MSEELELGKKRVCTGCKTKFYDFKKKPIICPTCGMEFDDLFFLKKVKTTKKSNMLDEEDPDFISNDTDLNDTDSDLLDDADDTIDVPLNKNIYSDDDDG